MPKATPPVPSGPEPIGPYSVAAEAHGLVFIAGQVALVEPGLDEHFERIMRWSDNFRMLRVRANADTALDARRAREFGAEGIGLCRTEHMFFDEDRILAMREMICAENEAGRRAALAKILPMQRRDFEDLFIAAKTFGSP